MLLTVIAGLIGLGIVIFVHETGHFLAAKASGIEVEAFSLGWGRPLLRYTWRGTEYRLSALPLGGYCKLKGEQALQNPDAATSEDLEGSLFAAPAWKRILTYAAGPVSNLLFSILILALLWWIGFSVQSYDNRIVLVSDYSFLSASSEKAEPYPAEAAGLQSGDRIVAINGREITHYRQIQESVVTLAGEEITIAFERNGVPMETRLVPQLNRDTGGGIIGVSPWIEPVIAEVEKNSAASAAGILPGDRILAIDGVSINNHFDLISVLQSHPLRFTMQVERDGERIDSRIIPGYDENGNPLLGISFENVRIVNRLTNPAAALARGFSDSLETVSVSVKSIGMLFQGINLQKAVSGPIRITYMVGQVASYGFSQGLRTGFTALFRFLSFLSVALFVMNLLPIPALDGGLILLSFYELLRRRQVSAKFFYRYQILGFLFIMALLVLTTFSDIFFFLGN